MTSYGIYAGYVGRCVAATCLAAGLALTAQPARAQQSAPATIRLQPEDQERGQYGPQSNFFFLPPGQTGENYQSAGFFGGKLRPYLTGNATALAALDSYKRQKTLYLVDKAVLVGSVGLYGSQVFGHGDAQYTSPTQLVAGGLFVSSLLATIFINRHTSEYLKQAVDEYNSDLPAGHHGTLWPRLRPAGAGLSSVGSHPVLALRWQL